MHLLLVGAMALAFQGQPAPHGASAYRRFAIALERMTRRRRPLALAAIVVPSPPSCRRRRSRTPTAKTTLLRARAASLTQDSALTGYDAMSYERISAGMGFGRIGRDRLLFRHESAAHIRWQQGVGIWVDVKGARTAIPMVSRPISGTKTAAHRTTPT